MDKGKVATRRIDALQRLGVHVAGVELLADATLAWD
jgi:hypothetical protein